MLNQSTLFTGRSLLSLPLLGLLATLSGCGSSGSTPPTTSQKAAADQHIQQAVTKAQNDPSLSPELKMKIRGAANTQSPQR